MRTDRATGADGYGVPGRRSGVGGWIASVAAHAAAVGAIAWWGWAATTPPDGRVAIAVAYETAVSPAETGTEETAVAGASPIQVAADESLRRGPPPVAPAEYAPAEPAPAEPAPAEPAATERETPRPASRAERPANIAPRAVAKRTPVDGRGGEVSAPAAHTAPAARPDPGWAAQVATWLERNKTYPSAARARGEQGDCVVRFTVDPHGAVERAEIVRGSGFPDLDAAALALLSGARLPPPGAGPGRIAVSVKIDYRLR